MVASYVLSPPLALQPRKSRRQSLLRGCREVLGFALANWPKLVILGLTIAGIVLVSIHGFSLFPRILGWFKRHNGWGGWVSLFWFKKGER